MNEHRLNKLFESSDELEKNIDEYKQKFKTLHEAIDFVLERNNRFMSFKEISGEIKKENLWRRKSDNRFPELFQIRLRTTVQKRYKTRYEFMKPDKVRLH